VVTTADDFEQLARVLKLEGLSEVDDSHKDQCAAAMGDTEVPEVMQKFFEQESPTFEEVDAFVEAAKAVFEGI
jgi:hypothetical protein